VLRLAERGDARCRRALADAGRAVGIVVADLCNLLSPQRVIVGGVLAEAGEVILGPLRETVAQRAVPAAVRAAEIVPSVLGERAELVGAICLALDTVSADLAGNVIIPTLTVP
jgi:predicted NBD/HSP70 family sugar kinase